MQLTGEMFIGAERVLGDCGLVPSYDPRTALPLPPEYGQGGVDEVERATRLAEVAFDTFRELDPESRARFLDRVSGNVAALGDELVDRAAAESGIPRPRVVGELARTVNQLAMFAEFLRAGDWLEVQIDPARPDRTPLPRVDIRQRHIALGPVAVFGSSNFPLAFSVAGGDTASAFAAGCPVIVKAHGAHQGTSELAAGAIAAAVRDEGLPEGVFSLLFGGGRTLGQSLVADPRVKAVAFTGSQAGGMALVRTAAARPEPIPVHAEMSSINPVFLLPEALRHRAAQIGADFVGSLALSAGQLCTNPGLMVAVRGEGFEDFTAAASRAVEAVDATPMLTESIHGAYEKAVATIATQPGVRRLAVGTRGGGPNLGQASLFEVDADDFLANPILHEEAFGAAGTVIVCDRVEQLVEVATALAGQLTATLHLDEGDLPLAATLLPVLERKAGRITVNNWPTGVEVGHAMVHGGPFPATSDSRTTSVGTLAIRRFLRPVAYQNLPDALLPAALRESNPLGVPRRIDGIAELVPAPTV